MASNTDKKILKAFGKNLEQLRENKGFTFRDFANEAEISLSSVFRLENGLTNPTLTTLLKIAEVLDVDLDELVKGIK